MSLRSKQAKFLLVNGRTQVWAIALRTALLYFLFGVLWILLSDTLVMTLVPNEKIRNIIFMSKGVLFVLLSTAFLYSLFHRSLKKLSDKEEVIRESRDDLSVMVYYDTLTGLSNRRKLTERLPEFLALDPGAGKALLSLDVDNIKLVNDTMGHTFGDYLIAKIARRLDENLLKDEEIFRIGGDEFVILTHYSRLGEINERAAAINHLFEAPFYIESLPVHSSVSIGISVYSMHGTNPVELLKFADIAMYRSKKEGKNRAVLFNINMMAPISDRMRIGEQLHSALGNSEFELYMQPQIRPESGKISSFESLIRWNNPVLGKVPPDIFIPVAEESHLILPIGEWVLRESCRFIRRIQQSGYPDIGVSVNISILQLIQTNFPSIVQRILDETGLNPELLELELTETVLIESFQQVKQPLENLRTLGIRLALDDFGKGYSSLSYLEQLPIDVLKIDKTFIDGICETNGDCSLTGNIVEIGKKLGLQVVAEGVETAGQLKYLTEQKCDKIQGWIFSKALSLEDAELFIKNNLDPDR
ncbi:MAG TPA: EAL domain-containing protein [Treponemataceae bacterium]|nr:EAL domain-containing protein [Treponemataceae bacterium]